MTYTPDERGSFYLLSSIGYRRVERAPHPCIGQNTSFLQYLDGFSEGQTEGY